MKLNQTIEQARNVIRFRQMSYRTEQTYLHWIERYARWCADHPDGDHAEKLNAFQQSQAQAAAADADPDANVAADTPPVDEDEDVIDADFKPAG